MGWEDLFTRTEKSKQTSEQTATGHSQQLNSLLSTVLQGLMYAGLDDAGREKLGFLPGSSQTGLLPFAQPSDLYNLGPEERSFVDSLMGISRDPNRAMGTVTPYETEGLSVLKSLTGPDYWKQYWDAYIKPEIANNFAAAGGAKGQGAYGELLNRGLIGLTPQMSQASTNYAGTLMGLGPNLINRALGLGKEGFTAAGIQRNSSLQDFGRRQNLTAQGLLGIPFTPTAMTTGTAKSRQIPSIADTISQGLSQAQQAMSLASGVGGFGMSSGTSAPAGGGGGGGSMGAGYVSPYTGYNPYSLYGK